MWYPVHLLWIIPHHGVLPFTMMIKMMSVECAHWCLRISKHLEAEWNNDQYVWWQFIWKPYCHLLVFLKESRRVFVKWDSLKMFNVSKISANARMPTRNVTRLWLPGYIDHKEHIQLYVAYIFFFTSAMNETVRFQFRVHVWSIEMIFVFNLIIITQLVIWTCYHNEVTALHQLIWFYGNILRGWLYQLPRILPHHKQKPMGNLCR